MPADLLLEINPPVGLDWRWWAFVALLALAAVAVMAVGVLRWRRLGGPSGPGIDTSLTQLRSDALDRITSAAAGYHSGKLGAQPACQEMGRTTRWFAGTASDGDADYETASQLAAAARRDPRLLDVSTFIDSIQDDCFSPTARPDVDAVAASAQEVIRAWH
ncbi:MAG: hypothetical protein Q4P15_08355 [Propionibacteriaceae bacterium]|nr:hypothetical protein [Propionibacteriaceae bacterium]